MKVLVSPALPDLGQVNLPLVLVERSRDQLCWWQRRGKAAPKRRVPDGTHLPHAKHRRDALEEGICLQPKHWGGPGLLQRKGR